MTSCGLRHLDWDVRHSDSSGLHIHELLHRYRYAITLPHPPSHAFDAFYHQFVRRVCDQRRNGCRTGWLLACAGLPPSPTPLPCCKSCVFMMCTDYVLMLLRCFLLFPNCTPYRSIVWGLPFFSPHLSSCHAVFFFLNALSSCPVYPLVILYVCLYGQVDG